MAAQAQMIDNTQAPNTAKAGINKSLLDEIGAGRGDVMTAGSSVYLINRDPFRSVRRGRQLFQRKFTRLQGQGANEKDGVGDINNDIAIGAGLSDSCALCHGRPRGSAGTGGNVVTRPDSRDAGHLFGLGLKEMLADEITTDLRSTRDLSILLAQQMKRPMTLKLTSKGLNYGTITGNPDGSVDTSTVQGVDADLRVKPFFAEGSTISLREFVVGALHNDGNSFLVKDILTDFKRHDVGVNFYERNWDGTIQTQFLTRPLWGVGRLGPTDTMAAASH
jgi:hypothetical protein